MSLLSRTTIGWGAAAALLLAAGAQAQEITPGASGVTASANDGHLPSNAVDNNLDTRWSADGDGQWLQLDLGSVKSVGFVKIAFFKGDVRTARADIQLATVAGVWTTVASITSSGTTLEEQTFDFPDRDARFVRYLGHGNSVNGFNSLTEIKVFSGNVSSGRNFTAAEVLAGVRANMVASKKVNTLPHINTQTRAKNVNVFQVTPGTFAYTSSMAIDTDGSDPDPDPDHQGETTFSDDTGRALGAHHLAFFVLGDDCFDRKTPCPHFFYKEHNIKGLQFALIFFNGKVIGSVFGDTQTANGQTTSDNDSRELGEASVHAASMLGIPSSGTTGGVDNGVTVVILSGPSWVVHGSTSTALNTSAQALVQKALNQLGNGMGL
jgi:hypothetical protein